MFYITLYCSRFNVRKRVCLDVYLTGSFFFVSHPIPCSLYVPRLRYFGASLDTEVRTVSAFFRLLDERWAGRLLNRAMSWYFQSPFTESISDLRRILCNIVIKETGIILIEITIPPYIVNCMWRGWNASCHAPACSYFGSALDRSFLSRDVNVHDVTKCKYPRNLLHFDEIFLVLFKKKRNENTKTQAGEGEDFV